eukprot:TRINITY_DN952_c1_g1_i2.p1 TRINITY_DN952_c1_g1~~TRINITY_DN952_c1_g1_i2.p1  ORF type:complete len:363 (-),score=58.15 TRINITY_DN952_c1_g1_i2:108-1196(-)
MNIGFFLSFTVFLAFNDPDFCNSYLRTEPQAQGIITLAAYLRFWGYTFAIITVMVALLKSGPELQFGVVGYEDGGDQNEGRKKGALSKSEQVGSMKTVKEAYTKLLNVVKLTSVQKLSLVLVTCRLAVLTAESAAPLKLLEKGVSKEALAGLVLLEFPMELLSAVMAGRYAARGKPFQPWKAGYRIRLVMAVLLTALVYYFPADASHLTKYPFQFLLLALLGLITSFTSTLMFTASGSFFNRISDPDMGGAYLTMLNTIANMGVILPKLVIFALMDYFTTRECIGEGGERWEFECPANMQLAKEDNECVDAGGKCVLQMDGFYPLSFGMVVLGVVLDFWYQSILPGLERLPLEQWRAHKRRS